MRSDDLSYCRVVFLIFSESLTVWMFCSVIREIKRSGTEVAKMAL